MTDDELAAIEARVRYIEYKRGQSPVALNKLLGTDIPALPAEVRRLRAAPANTNDTRYCQNCGGLIRRGGRCPGCGLPF